MQDAISERALFFYDDGAIRSSFAQVVDAVAFCHDQGLFHRDIRPRNILCSLDGQRVFLSNFRLATEKEVSEEFGIGTLPYLSPDALNADYELKSYSTRQGDVWALGVMLIDMLTGSTPWREATIADADFRHYLRSPSCFLNGMPLSPEAKRLVRRILHHNGPRRISPRELLARLPSVKTFFPTKDELRVASAHVLVQVQRLMDRNIAGRRHSPRVWQQRSSQLRGALSNSPRAATLDARDHTPVDAPFNSPRSSSNDDSPDSASPVFSATIECGPRSRDFSSPGTPFDSSVNQARLDFCTSPASNPASATSPGECLWQVPPWQKSTSRQTSVGTGSDRTLVDGDSSPASPKRPSVHSLPPLTSSVSRHASLPTFTSAIGQIFKECSSASEGNAKALSDALPSPLLPITLLSFRTTSQCNTLDLSAFPAQPTRNGTAGDASPIRLDTSLSAGASDIEINSPRAQIPAPGHISAGSETSEAESVGIPYLGAGHANTSLEREPLLSHPPSLVSGNHSVSQLLSALSMSSHSRAPSSPLIAQLPPGASLLRMLSRVSTASSTGTPSPWTPATPTWLKLGAYARSLSSLAAEERALEKGVVRVVSSGQMAEDGVIRTLSGPHAAESAAALHFGAKVGARIARLRSNLSSNAVG
ncbi:unnamed protein product [Peniophora sp. CBMAI 1063]|nr:unnamed protein product [Peniophora sp. CBMAI 1063]